MLVKPANIMKGYEYTISYDGIYYINDFSDVPIWILSSHAI